MIPDDSALLHRADYDPAKAREYYLRTRQLKGRRAAAARVPTGKPRADMVNNLPKKPSTSKQAELRAQRAALMKRLERLREVLKEVTRQGVADAKKRSGVKEPEKSSSDSKTSKKSESKKDKPDTAAEKRDKAKKAREEYEKEKGPSLSSEVDALNRQIKDIRAKIEAAIKDARDQSNGKARGKPSAAQFETASKGR